MDSNSKNAGLRTPSKDPKATGSKIQETPKVSENSDPNVATVGLGPSTPASKSAKSQKSVSRMAYPSPRNRIRERKFVVAKKNPKKEKAGEGRAVTCKCKERHGRNVPKCQCVAYETLRASQEEFFQNQGSVRDQWDLDQLTNCERADFHVGGGGNGDVGQAPEIGDLIEGETEKGETDDPDVNDPTIEMGNSNDKRKRDKLLEEAMDSLPEPGFGRVMHLVKTFERYLSIRKSKDSEQNHKKEKEDTRKGMKWAVPGMQPKVPETDEPLSSLCPSDMLLTSENLGLDSNVSSSWDSSQRSFSISTRTSCGVQRSRRNSSESSGTMGGRNRRRRQLKVTCQKPFKLWTEQRGKQKEEEFIKKVQEMMVEEEKQRIPIAQGLPWTTEEPECLVKPPVKDQTRPLDIKLHSDVRAVERAEFDHQVAEKLSRDEQIRMEREKQWKLEEEEEIRRLRRNELIPKAQPMPYFDRPFIPRRSLKDLTVPREPKFHIPHHKKIKCRMSWNDMNIYSHHY